MEGFEIKTYEDTISHMLHNETYKGVLRSGDTCSEVIPELQIIDGETFQRAQDLMDERRKERNLDRRVPLNTRGQSLLSGEVFCGDCGGRLVLTTNAKKYIKKDGTVSKSTRIRYICYNKSRKRCECHGQSGYSQKIIDKQIMDLLKSVFDKLKAVDPFEVISKAQRKVIIDLDKKLADAKKARDETATDYEKIKADVKRAMASNNALLDVLTDIATEAREKMIDANEYYLSVSREIEDAKNNARASAENLSKLLGWAEMFDECDMETKKMIVAMLIKRVDVFPGYKMKVEFNFDLEQFELGL